MHRALFARRRGAGSESATAAPARGFARAGFHHAATLRQPVALLDPAFFIASAHFRLRLRVARFFAGRLAALRFFGVGLSAGSGRRLLTGFID